VTTLFPVPHPLLNKFALESPLRSDSEGRKLASLDQTIDGRSVASQVGGQLCDGHDLVVGSGFWTIPHRLRRIHKIKIPRRTKIFAVSTLTVLSSTAAYFGGVRTRAKGVSENERGRAAYAPYDLQNKT